MTLESLSQNLAICRLRRDESIPAWALSSEFFSITRTGDELSIVCAEEVVPLGQKVELGWRALKVKGPLDFGLTGVLASLLVPLAESKISISSISTYDTDYILVKSDLHATAIDSLKKSGHIIEEISWA